jgi:mannose-6-phosphate isomerase-like protein (cupin superfamily)
MFYVIKGNGKVIHEGQTIKLEPECAAYIPRRVKFRVEEAAALNVVMPTGPAWSPEQAKWLG